MSQTASTGSLALGRRRRTRGRVGIVVRPQLRRRLDAFGALLRRPPLDGAVRVEHTPGAELRRALLHLIPREPVGLPGPGPDRPLPPEPVRRAGPVEQVGEERVLAVAPARPGPHGPLTREPHPGLVHQPAVLVQLRDRRVHTGHVARPGVVPDHRRAGRPGAQVVGEGRAHPGVHMPRVLLPGELVAVLRAVARGGVGDVLPQRGERQQPVADPRRHPRGAAALGRPDLVASPRVVRDVEGGQRLVGGGLTSPERRRRDRGVAREVGEMLADEGDRGVGAGFRNGEAHTGAYPGSSSGPPWLPPRP